MTDDDLTLIATRIMDRAERDGNGLHLSSIVQELRAGLAIVEAKRRDAPVWVPVGNQANDIGANSFEFYRRMMIEQSQ